MKLLTSDYKKILKFYKLSIPKKSKNIKKKADKIIAKKFCSCIKKVQQKFKKEGIAIGICTKSVITRKGYKRGKFKCKKRRTVKLQKGGRRKTRKKRGGKYYDDEGYLVRYEKHELFDDKGYSLNIQEYKISIDGKEKWMTWDQYEKELLRINKINMKLQECSQQQMMNTISEEDDISPQCIMIYPIRGKKHVRFKDGGKKKRKTRKKRGSMKKTNIEAARERLKKAAMNINKTTKNLNKDIGKLRISPVILTNERPLTKSESEFEEVMNRSLFSPINNSNDFKTKDSKGGKRRRRTRKKK